MPAPVTEPVTILAYEDEPAQTAAIDEAIAALGTFEAQVQAVVDRALQRLAALRQACENFGSGGTP